MEVEEKVEESGDVLLWNDDDDDDDDAEDDADSADGRRGGTRSGEELGGTSESSETDRCRAEGSEGEEDVASLSIVIDAEEASVVEVVVADDDADADADAEGDEDVGDAGIVSRSASSRVRFTLVPKGASPQSSTPTTTSISMSVIAASIAATGTAVAAFFCVAA